MSGVIERQSLSSDKHRETTHSGSTAQDATNDEYASHTREGEQQVKSVSSIRLQNYPIATTSTYSLFSSQSPTQNFRGFFHLAGLILFVANARLFVENLMKYGLLLSFDTLAGYLDRGAVYWFACIPVCIAAALFLEQLSAANKISESQTMSLVCLNLFALPVIPIVVILLNDWSPSSGIILLFGATLIWLKLVSYAAANRQYRLDLAEKKPFVERGAVSQFDGELILYPNNLTAGNIIYFIAAPTLCYQINYPRTPKIRWTWMLGKLLQLVVCIVWIIFMLEQWCFPTVKNSIDHLKNKNVVGIVERVMKLSIPSLYLWLTGFYAMFHLWFNVVAEVLRFGQRDFYKDWWNATTMEYYWRAWNIPTHNWLVRHIYMPALRKGYSKTVAQAIVFLFSAIFHELIISVPLKSFKLYFFIGMLSQIPALLVGKYFRGSVWGNIFFWVTFCFLGQPVGILLYYFDYTNEVLSKTV